MENIVSITLIGVQEEDTLYSSHEEADTRMVLHASKANEFFADANTDGCVILSSTYTDVLVLLVHYFDKF